MGFEYFGGICEIERFGTGVDGDYLQNGGVVTYTGPKHYNNGTLENNAVFGPADERVGALYGQGVLDIDATSKLQARFTDGFVGGASRNTVGDGNNGAFYYGIVSPNVVKWTAFAGHGAPGGGGGAVQKGGSTRNQPVCIVISPQAYYLSYRAGLVGNGVVGITPGTPIHNNDLVYHDCPFERFGLPGGAAGGGGVDSIGSGVTTGTSGKGADGGKAGGFLDIRFREIRVAAAGGINANGENGQDGDNATDSTNLDAECGGGGGSGGGSGGLITYLCETIDNPGNVQALGGTGGTGGAPVGGGGIGGTGGNGAGGIVAPCCLAA